MKANGAAVRALRESRGLTISGLAAAIGRHHSYVLRIETGERRGSPDVLVAIAMALRVPLVAILAVPGELDAA